MDMETRRDMETMAEWAATQDAWDRLLERRARRRRTLKFWLSWRQVVDDPGAAVPAPGAQAQSHTCAPAPPGAGTRAAGSIRRTPAAAALTSGLVSGSGVPGGPHIAAGRGPHFVSNGTSKKPRPAVPHLSYSEASHISAALNRHT